MPTESWSTRTGTYRRVWDRWAALNGLDPDLVWAATHGRRPEETIAEVAPELHVPAAYERLRYLLSEDGGAFPLYPSVAEFLATHPPYTWAVVTSGRAEAVRERLRDGRAPTPDVLVDGAAVDHDKPDPGCYLLAASRLGALPADCLVVEDAPLGVRAGRAAGMQTLGLATTHGIAEFGEADDVAPSFADARNRLLVWLRGPAEGH